MAHLPDTATAFAAIQAAWRFFTNDPISWPALVQPLRQAGREAALACSASCLLLGHDWSKIDYPSHTSKHDKAQITHQHAVGYEMATAWLVSAKDGAPLAPLEIELTTADTVHSWREAASPLGSHHLDQILLTRHASLGWGRQKSLVQVSDREADSVGHYRPWHQAGCQFLVRADDRRVLWRDHEVLLSAVASVWQAEGAFTDSREAL